MGVIRQPITAVKASTGLSSTDSTAHNTDAESVASSGTVTPVPGPVSQTGAGVCPLQVRRNLGTHSLRLKQGRRTKQRCENEKMLMSMYGIDEEDIWGTDVSHQTRSYFMDLVNSENEELLDQFINNQEPRYFSKEKMTSRKEAIVDEETFEPETAFLKIASNLRQALKKRSMGSIGMLEGLEETLTDHFVSNPKSEYVREDLSSFERLLVHALCAYNSLNSHSFDFAGKRLVRVENPHPTFFRRDPGLCRYLSNRNYNHGC